MNYRFSKTVGKRKLHGGLFCGLFAIIAMVVATLTLDAYMTTAGAVGMSMATVPLFTIQPPMMEQLNPEGGGGGGAGLSEKEFQDKTMSVLKGVSEKQTAHAEKTDKLIKDLKGLQESYDGSEESIKMLEKKIGQISMSQKMQRRAFYEDGVEMITADPEKKTLFNAIVRQSIKEAGKAVTLSEEHQKALDSASEPGSTFVHDALMSDVYDLLSKYGVWSSFDVRTVGTKTNKFLVKTARPIAKIFGEGIDITEDTAKSGTSVTCEALGIKVLLSVPNELLEDSEIDLANDILVDFIEAVAFRMDWICLSADGTSDDLNGGYTGIFEGGTPAVAATGRTTVEDLEFEDVTAPMLAVDAAVVQRGGKWWIHPQMLIRFLHIKDGNGRPLFNPSTSVPSTSAIGVLLGAPVELAAAAPNANVAGAKVATFGDSKGFVCGLRKKFEFAKSEEAKFSEYETSFRGVARFGGKIRVATAFGVLTLAAS